MRLGLNQGYWERVITMVMNCEPQPISAPLLKITPLTAEKQKNSAINVNNKRDK